MIMKTENISKIKQNPSQSWFWTFKIL